MSQIRNGALLSYVGLGVNILTGLLYTPWMIHSIGKDNFGLYTLAISIISLFVFDFGLSAAVSRFLSKYLVEGEQQKANNSLGLVARLYLAIDVFLLLIFVGVYFFIPDIYAKLTPDEISKFQVVYIISSVFSVVSFPFIQCNGILLSNEKFVQLKLCDLAHKLIIVVVMTACLLLGYGLYALVAVNAIAGISTILLKLVCIKKYTKTRPNFNYSNPQEIKEIFRFSGWTSLTAISQRMIFNIAPTILGMMSGSSSIAILGVAITVEGYVYTFANALNGMFLPRVSAILFQDKGDLLPLMIKVGRIQIFIIGLVILGFIGFGRQFVYLWVGSEFANTYWCAILLILPSFFHLPQEIAATGIIAANKVKQQAWVYVFMGVVNIILAFPLAAYWGEFGVALSICIAYFVRTIGMNILYVKELGIDIKLFFQRSFLEIAPILIIMAIPVFWICSLVNIPGWIGFITKGMFFVFVYVLTSWFFLFNQEEKKLFKSLFL